MAQKKCRSMSEWANDKNGPICKPCIMPVLISWYETELEDQGRKDLADKLHKAKMKPSATPEGIAVMLDNIKTQIIPNNRLYQKLIEFDCLCQEYKE